MNTLTHADLLSQLHYDPETGVFTRLSSTRRGYKVGGGVGTLNDRNYYVIRINKKTYASHQLAWFYIYGTWPTNVIDHINRDSTDNRIANLRDIPQWGNTQNRGPNKACRSGLKGIDGLPNGKWRARIGHKDLALSKVFATQEEAIAWRKTKEQELHLFSPLQIAK